MGARWLKSEEEAIRKYYPTAPRATIIKLIPNRTWSQTGVHARKIGVYRTMQAKGESIREGRRVLKKAYSDAENERFDRTYPTLTHTTLLILFPGRTLSSIQSHAHRRHLYRTKEAGARQMRIGHEEAKRKR